MTRPDAERRATEIARLNDQLRFTLCGSGVVFTTGILALPTDSFDQIIEAVRLFSDFTAENNPHGEHDCAVVVAGGELVLWKVDYYDRALEYGSPNPADPAVTARMLTIMLLSEY